MRDHRPSRINYPLLLAVLALHAALFAWALQPVTLQPLHRSAAGKSEPAAPASPAQAARRRHAAAQAISDYSPEADDPRREFSPQQWRDNQAQADAAQLQRELGAHASAAQTDPARLLRELQQALAHGEKPAAQAAAGLHDECSNAGANAQALAATPPAELLRGLATGSSALLQASFEARLQRLRAQARRCAAWAQARAQLDAARRAYAQRADADAFEALRVQQQLDPATPGLLARLREGLERLWQQQSDSAVGRNLALLLLDDDDAQRRELGLRLLQQLGDKDDSEVDFVAGVLSQGYGRLPPQPALAERWQRRAAELGAAAAVDAELQREPVRAAAEQAWAWRAWRIWLNAHGCYRDAARPDDTLLAQDLRALQALDAQLDSIARAKAGQFYRERIDEWGERARTARHCGEPTVETPPTLRSRG